MKKVEKLNQAEAATKENENGANRPSIATWREQKMGTLTDMPVSWELVDSIMVHP